MALKVKWLTSGSKYCSDGNIVEKYRYASIFLDIESIDTKIKIAINIQNKRTKGSIFKTVPFFTYLTKYTDEKI